MQCTSEYPSVQPTIDFDLQPVLFEYQILEFNLLSKRRPLTVKFYALSNFQNAHNVGFGVWGLSNSQVVNPCVKMFLVSEKVGHGNTLPPNRQRE